MRQHQPPTSIAAWTQNAAAINRHASPTTVALPGMVGGGLVSVWGQESVGLGCERQVALMEQEQHAGDADVGQVPHGVPHEGCPMELTGEHLVMPAGTMLSQKG
eukprot:CAMPEP_0196733616 /NCGR_PEP_ID=MMETSP1091-20130531/12589_1 /TAXON_ID=302021 /ORGANISM="Rhodomonas sp., Strain CCMP768" /LENGTH=103 /DNA_ID=CAMNT_0042077003 /DNA_START=212 /DNA_END=523 /DNA_ORIENTATION=+